MNGLQSCDTADWSIGTVCNLTCNEGYERKGDLQRRCGLNQAQQVGEWSNEAGTCEGTVQYRAWIPFVVRARFTAHTSGNKWKRSTSTMIVPSQNLVWKKKIELNVNHMTETKQTHWLVKK